MKRFRLLIGLAIVSACSLYAQPFSNYTGDQYHYTLSPGWSGWSDSRAVCWAPWAGRSVGLGVNLYTSCSFPFWGTNSSKTWWDPLVGWTIYGETRAIRLSNGWTQQYGQWYSRCSEGLGDIADVIEIENSSYDCIGAG
jgi:hypothetical protein